MKTLWAKRKEADLRTPWKNCPTVWKAFCEELKFFNFDPIILYRNNYDLYAPPITIREAFKIFYAGFKAGGCS